MCYFVYVVDMFSVHNIAPSFYFCLLFNILTYEIFQCFYYLVSQSGSQSNHVK